MIEFENWIVALLICSIIVGIFATIYIVCDDNRKPKYLDIYSIVSEETVDDENLTATVHSYEAKLYGIKNNGKKKFLSSTFKFVNKDECLKEANILEKALRKKYKL